MMKRYECLDLLAGMIPEDALVVTSLGGVIAEWANAAPREGNYFTYHSMGLASSIACGLALALPHRKVLCLDGDGSMMMNLGTLATIGEQQPRNLMVIVFDNQMYEATGGQPSRTRTTDLAKVAQACGIASAVRVEDLASFEARARELLNGDSVGMIVARVEPGMREVPIPTEDPRENKYRFLRHIEATEGIKILPPFFI